MQEIEFETDQVSRTSSSPYLTEKKEPAMVKWLTKLGIKDEETANFVLLGIAGLFLGITIFIYAGLFAETPRDLAAEKRAILIMQNSI